jgi:RNA polymerase sigma factor (sigma-70 family)
MQEPETIEAIQTRWSLIRSAHLDAKPDTAQEARRILVMRYAPAIRRYIGGILQQDDQADEIAQEVMLRMMRGDFAGADENKGRFRDFLKMALRNMVKTSWRKANRRQTVDLQAEQLPADEDRALEEQWTATWRRNLLDNTWNRLHTDQAGITASHQFKALRMRVDFPEESSTELAKRLSSDVGERISSENFRQLLRRGRVRFAHHLIDEIRAGLGDESEERLQDELAELELLELVKDYLVTS